MNPWNNRKVSLKWDSNPRPWKLRKGHLTRQRYWSLAKILWFYKFISNVSTFLSKWIFANFQIFWLHKFKLADLRCNFFAIWIFCGRDWQSIRCVVMTEREPRNGDSGRYGIQPNCNFLTNHLLDKPSKISQNWSFFSGLRL